MWRRGEIDAHNCLFPLVMDCAAHRDYTLILVCVPVCFPGIDAHLENFTGPGLRDGSCWYLSTIHHVQYSTPSYIHSFRYAGGREGKPQQDAGTYKVHHVLQANMFIRVL